MDVDFNSEVSTLSAEALASMGLSVPVGWDVGYRAEPRDEGWFLVALVSDGDALLCEEELQTAEEFSDGDLKEVCADAVLAAVKQEGI